MHRAVALRFLGDLATRLGGPATVPYLPPMLRPLYRISEATSSNEEEVGSKCRLAPEVPTMLGLARPEGA